LKQFGGIHNTINSIACLDLEVNHGADRVPEPRSW
jgi:hypothetical protein